jgi:hypothetical protein
MRLDFLKKVNPYLSFNGKTPWETFMEKALKKAA